MSDIFRSSWGVMLLWHALAVVFAFAGMGLIAFRAERASWKDQRGYGLVEVAVALLVIVVAVILLVRLL